MATVSSPEFLRCPSTMKGKDPVPNQTPPLCPEFTTARVCAAEAAKVVKSLTIIGNNSDVGTISGLARETLKLALTLKRRADARWKTVSTKYAVQSSFLGDGASLAEEGDQEAEEAKEEIDRLGGVR